MKKYKKKNKWYHAKVLLKRFHLSGHITGFRQQDQKLESHYMSSYLTLGMKVLTNSLPHKRKRKEAENRFETKPLLTGRPPILSKSAI